MWSSSFHTLAVIASTAVLDTMLAFTIGIHVKFCWRDILYGVRISIFSKCGKHRRGAMVCFMVSLQRGMALRVLFHVVRPCVRVAALGKSGSV